MNYSTYRELREHAPFLANQVLDYYCSLVKTRALPDCSSFLLDDYWDCIYTHWRIANEQN